MINENQWKIRSQCYGTINISRYILPNCHQTGVLVLLSLIVHLSTMSSFKPAIPSLADGDRQRPVLQSESVVDDATRARHCTSRQAISFEEYVYYADITRAKEKDANARFLAAQGPRAFRKFLKGRFSKGNIEPVTPNTIVAQDIPCKIGGHGTSNLLDSTAYQSVTPAERETANRALRTASWGNIFYLITIDLLGPMSSP